MITLKDKITLITGASSGIGEATARAFACEGAKLILLARRQERLAALAEELRVEFQTQSLVLPLNLRKHGLVEDKLRSLPEEWRDVEILVNNAGLVRGLQKLYTMDSADWHEVIDVNVKALIAVTNSIVPGMVEVISTSTSLGPTTFETSSILNSAAIAASDESPVPFCVSVW